MSARSSTVSSGRSWRPALLAAWAWGIWHALDSALGDSLVAQILSVGLAARRGGIFAYLAACYGLRVPEARMLGQVLRPLR